MFLRLSFVVLFFACFAACQIESSDKDDGSVNIKLDEEMEGKLTEIGKQIGDIAKEQKKKAERRKEKGDTAALHYKELAKFMPDIAGYTSEKGAKGSVNKAMGFSISTSKQKFTNDAGEDIDISIVDYVGASALYSIAAAAIKSDFYSESDEELIRTLDLGMEDVIGMEVLDKEQKKATLTVGVGDRFLITMNAENQEDTEGLKALLKEMDLETMAGM